MLWLILVIISVFVDGIRSIIHRYLMKSYSAYAYTLLENALTTILFIPFLIAEYATPASWWHWLFPLVSGCLWAGVVWLNYYAYQHTHVSLKEPLSQARLIFVFLLGILILHESANAEKVVGTLLIFGGVLVLTFHQRKLFGSLADKGVRLTLLAAVLASVITIWDKTALGYFSAGMYGFLIYLIPTLVLLPFLPTRVKETKTLWTKKWPVVCLVVILGMNFYLVLKAYQMAEASVIFPLLRLSMLVSMTGGMIFYKEERTNIGKKILAAIIILLGAILISGKYVLF